MPRDKFGKTVKTADHKATAHKPDGFKSQDQTGGGAIKAGKPTDNGKRGTGDGKKEKTTGKEPSYGRKRH